jgi:hypothetical protein
MGILFVLSFILSRGMAFEEEACSQVFEQLSSRLSANSFRTNRKGTKGLSLRNEKKEKKNTLLLGKVASCPLLTASVGRQFVKTKGASGGGEQG